MKNIYNKSLSVMLIAICTSTFTYAQIVGEVSFLKGKWTELAVSDCGTYGSGANGTIIPAPEGYNENMLDGSLSFTNDYAQDGWDIGIPDQCGDYIMPGSPEEGFALQIGDGQVYGNLQPYCYAFGSFVADHPHFPGENIVNVNAGLVRKSLWQGTNTFLGIAINQTTYYGNKKQAFLTIVDVCNGGDEITDLYYGRNIDPDNDQVTNGTFSTTNSVKKQYLTAGYSHVAAASTVFSPCYVGYVSADPRAKVSRGNFSMGDPYDMWNGLSGYVQAMGPNTADESIQISFKIETIAHNDCECFAYATVFSPSSVAENVALTPTACENLTILNRHGEDMIDEYINDPEFFLKNEFVAYPNPSNGNFTLNLFEIENANIKVVNALGELVYSAVGVSKIAGVYLDNALPGLYFITIEHDGTSKTKSIVIE